jgi:ABC-type sugar transport system ATPase subunit
MTYQARTQEERMTTTGRDLTSMGPGSVAGSMSHTDPAVVMRGIRKAFGPVEVLHGIDFEVLPGEIHVLAGENGAGKSTLIKILSGAYSDFTGELQVGGRTLRFARPSEAVRAGIATIHQELSLVPSMTVADNLFLGWEVAGRFGGVDFALQRAEAARILEEMELDCSPRQLISELPISCQQSLEIARALTRDASVLILDEPTSALNEREVDALFVRLRELRSRNRSIVYITHRMEEIYQLADRITVLRDGALVGTAPVADLPPANLVRWMVGRDLPKLKSDATQVVRTAAQPARDEPALAGARGAALEVENLRVAHPAAKGHLVVGGVSFTLNRGEVLGLAGLEGSGKSEVLHALFGALGRRADGQLRLFGEPFSMKGPRESVERGVVLLTNDRKSLGLAPELSVTHSVSLASLRRFSGRCGWMRRREESKAVRDLTREFRLRAPSDEAPVRSLSGGNQQKVYLARCLLPQPRVLLLDEPTRGIDVGAKADIYDLMRTWVAQGIAILLVTSEMDELLALSDRIIVMHSGRISTEVMRDTASKDAVLAAAMGSQRRQSNGR